VSLNKWNARSLRHEVYFLLILNDPKATEFLKDDDENDHAIIEVLSWNFLEETDDKLQQIP